MKRFLRKAAIFFGILVATQLLFFTFNRVYGPTLIDVKEHMVFMGNSMVRRSMNPEYFKDSKNLGAKGELYISTYHKLKYLLERFSQIDTVVVGFSYLELADNVDRRFLYQEKSGRYIRNSLAYMSPKVFYKETMASGKMILSNVYQSEFLYPKFKDPVFINGFGKKTGHLDPNELESILLENFYTEEEISSFATTNIKYLHKIVDLCLEKDKTLVLITSPQHPDYLDKVPKKFVSYHTQLSKLFKEKGITLINMVDMLADSQYYADHVHLSYTGSIEVSKKVKSVFEEYKGLNKQTEYE